MDINPISIFNKYRNNQYGWENNPVFKRVSNLAYNFGGASPLRAESDFARGQYLPGIAQTAWTAAEAYGGAKALNAIKGAEGVEGVTAGYSAKNIPQALSGTLNAKSNAGALAKGLSYGTYALDYANRLKNSIFNPVAKFTNPLAQPVQPLKYDPTTGASLIPGTQVYKEASNKVPALVTSMQAANNPATTTNLAANYNSTTQPTSTTQSIGQYVNQNDLTTPPSALDQYYGALSAAQHQDMLTQQQNARDQYQQLLAQSALGNQQAQNTANFTTLATNRAVTGGGVDIGQQAANSGMADTGVALLGQRGLQQQGTYQNALTQQTLANSLANNKLQNKLGAASLNDALAQISKQYGIQQAQDMIDKFNNTALNNGQIPSVNNGQ